MANRILVKSNGAEPRVQEALAGAALKPGHLLTYSSATVIKHGTDDGNLAYGALIAIEQEAIGGDADDAYASGDTVHFIHARPGDLVRLRLAANATAISLHAALGSAGDGTVEAKTAQSINESGSATTTIKPFLVRFRAAEAVDNSASSSEAFILCEVI